MAASVTPSQVSSSPVGRKALIGPALYGTFRVAGVAKTSVTVQAGQTGAPTADTN
jgi:hypothetical protein